MADSGIWVTLAGGVGSSLGAPTTNNGGPAIVASATTRYVAWIDTASGIPAVYVATESGSSWGQLAGSAQGGGISGLLQAASEPAIALLASGQPIVAWTAQTPGATDIDVAEYNPNANGGAGGWVALGKSLSPGGISQTGKASNAQILLVNGEPTVVWLDTSGGVANIYAAQFNGTAWVPLGTGAASGGGISGSPIAVTQFAAATNGSNVAVAWTQDFPSSVETLTTPPTQIYVTQFSSGTWSALGGSASGNGLSQGLDSAAAPTVAYLGGNLFVAWQQYITNPAQSETIFEQAPVIYAAEYTSGAWQPAGTGAETGFGVSGDGHISLAPQLVSNGSHLMPGVVGRLHRFRQHRYASLYAHLERHEFRAGAAGPGERGGDRAEQRRAGRSVGRAGPERQSVRGLGRSGRRECGAAGDRHASDAGEHHGRW